MMTPIGPSPTAQGLKALIQFLSSTGGEPADAAQLRDMAQSIMRELNRPDLTDGQRERYFAAARELMAADAGRRQPAGDLNQPGGGAGPPPPPVSDSIEYRHTGERERFARIGRRAARAIGDEPEKVETEEDARQRERYFLIGQANRPDVEPAERRELLARADEIQGGPAVRRRQYAHAGERVRVERYANSHRPGDRTGGRRYSPAARDEYVRSHRRIMED